MIGHFDSAWPFWMQGTGARQWAAFSQLTELHSAGSSTSHMTWDAEAGELLEFGSSLPAWSTWRSFVTSKQNK